MQKNSDLGMDSTMIELKARLKEIVPQIKIKSEIIYLDYPFHNNVGDLLIYKGTLLFFQDNGIQVKLCRSEKDLCIREIKNQLTSTTTIICHGGGNFGDLYRTHQNLRELVVQNFPKNRIIIMPQTAYFSDEADLEKSAAVFRTHPDVIIYARDSRSFEILKKFSDHVVLMPDMAHQLYGNLDFAPNRGFKTLYFLRTDCETNAEQRLMGSAEGENSVDWGDLLTKNDLRKTRLLRKLAKIAETHNIFFLKQWIDRRWRLHTHELTNRFSRVFSSYQEVVTSRMHGHILSCLVNTPNALIDNSYGKNSSYFTQWTSKVKNTKLIQSP